jgi:hypothetical protein
MSLLPPRHTGRRALVEARGLLVALVLCGAGAGWASAATAQRTLTGQRPALVQDTTVLTDEGHVPAIRRATAVPTAEEAARVDRQLLGRPGLDPTDNFTDYSDDACMTHCTPGQGTRMRDVANAFRAALIH